MPEGKGLGRLPSADPRDQLFSLASVIPPTTTRTKRFWYGYRWWLDQGSTPQCVAYSWTHFLTDSPTTHNPARLEAPADLYHEAQQVDEFPGDNYDGTSVRAGAKVLQSQGKIGAYLWAGSLEEMIRCVLEQGPVVVGTNWYEQMFTPGADHFIRIGGAVAGGHAWKVDGVNTDAQFFRMKNSWGETWGNNGFARVSFPDMQRLLNEDGEACLALEP